MSERDMYARVFKTFSSGDQLPGQNVRLARVQTVPTKQNANMSVVVGVTCLVREDQHPRAIIDEELANKQSIKLICTRLCEIRCEAFIHKVTLV